MPSKDRRLSSGWFGVLLLLASACGHEEPIADTQPSTLPALELDEAAWLRARADEPNRELRALALAERAPSRYRLSAGASLTVGETTTDRFGISHVRLYPSFHGRPVIGYVVAIHLHDTGDIIAPASSTPPPPAPRFESPTLSAVEALAHARLPAGIATLAYLPVLARSTTSEDWELRGYRLIYQVRDDASVGEIARIDAHTGEELGRGSTILEAGLAKQTPRSSRRTTARTTSARRTSSCSPTTRSRPRRSRSSAPHRRLPSTRPQQIRTASAISR